MINYLNVGINNMKNEKWIDCKDRLPERTARYLCIGKKSNSKRVKIFLFNSVLKCWETIHEIGYWMELPKLPCTDNIVDAHILER